MVAVVLYATRGRSPAHLPPNVQKPTLTGVQTALGRGLGVAVSIGNFIGGLGLCLIPVRYVTHLSLHFVTAQSIAQAHWAGKSGVHGAVFRGKTGLPDTLSPLSSAMSRRTDGVPLFRRMRHVVMPEIGGAGG